MISRTIKCCVIERLWLLVCETRRICMYLCFVRSCAHTRSNAINRIICRLRANNTHTHKHSMTIKYNAYVLNEMVYHSHSHHIANGAIFRQRFTFICFCCCFLSFFPMHERHAITLMALLRYMNQSKLHTSENKNQS